MRIDENKLTSVNAGSLGQTQAAELAEQASRKAEPGRAGAPGASDEVQLSSLAEKVQSLEPDSAASQARLEELTKLVASGKYSPDAETIADNLIEDALENRSPGGPA